MIHTEDVLCQNEGKITKYVKENFEISLDGLLLKLKFMLTNIYFFIAKKEEEVEETNKERQKEGDQLIRPIPARNW